ncbi:MAG: diguanylate cyclase [Gammaproteobacteria bacterium]|jgi:two-component system cell cycle response regulator
MYNGNETASLYLDDQPADDSYSSRKPKLLIVDDSATIRATLSRAVGDEFDSLEATNGEEALQLLIDDLEIDLVVTDLAMPRMDGYDLIKQMRAHESSRLINMPVIVVTGANDTAAREKAFIAGANDFIAKTSDHVEFLARVRAHVKLAQTIQELEQSRRYLKEQADTDPLTKLANRRSFFASASTNLAQMQRQNEHFSIIILDIDHFKRINDTYGHQAGDVVLQQLAAVLATAIREGDSLARIGGEEFVVASPYTNRLAAIVLSERLRKAVEDAEFVFDGNRIPVTISLGVASMNKGGDDVDKLLAVADSRLYLAKQKGRNRICASDKTGKTDRLMDLDMVCPKLDEAITMIKHGNTFRLQPHLFELNEQLIPILELASQQGTDPALDMEAIKQAIESLKKLEQ